MPIFPFEQEMSTLPRASPGGKIEQQERGKAMAFYHNTVVHMWAKDTIATADEAGTIIKHVRGRKDMPHRFTNKRHMYEYLVRTGLTPSAPAMAEAWFSYRMYNERVSHVPVDVEDPDMLIAALAKTARRA